MAAITNPAALKFVNERVRPLCEKLRGLKAEIDSAASMWSNGGSTAFATPTDTVEDRADEGLMVLTAQEITDIATKLVAVRTAIEASSGNALVEKACVRPLRTG